MKKKIFFGVCGLVCGVAAAYFFGVRYVDAPQTFSSIKNDTDNERATLASGCFWCMEATMQETEGVVDVVSGYAGGDEANPTYEDVYSGRTGHREAVQVIYDPQIISYEQILEIFWKNIDPVDAGGQFVDRGFSYTTAIFYHDEVQRVIAEASKEVLAASGVFEEPIATSILPYTTFYPAEEYHQDFYKKSKLRYSSYENGSGRKEYKERIWEEIQKEQSLNNTLRMATQKYTPETFSKPAQDVLKEQLTELQYKVTQKEGTERPFDNEYWDNHQEGIYVDIVSGEPLFSSTDKYDSGTGWPSFLKPIDESFVTKHDDYKLFVKRTEIRSAIADSHLGHIIMDGPASNNHVRYCMNSASLSFVPKEKLEELGYGEYRVLFE